MCKPRPHSTAVARARTVTVAGGRSFEYVAQGSGRATLMVHPGGPGYTYHYLRALLRLATAHLRVILFNPRGVGRSWRPARASAYTVQNQADDVEAIRRALKIEELHLLGFSAGGFTALEYAGRFQDHLTSLILCATAGSAAEVRQSNRVMRATATPRQRTELRELERAGAYGTRAYRALYEEITNPFQARFLSGTPRDLRAARLSGEVYRAMMTRTGDEFAVDGTLGRWDGRKYYSRIEVPTLVLVGRFDPFLEAAQEAHDRIVPAHLRVLPRSSHLVHLEQPREFLVDVTGD
jgi:proline iminopeptidase